ncbi:MAG: 16S rRNA (adenine(1518)-N(6)/adenine(1519)-N(6))-dimethyltransferase RsmA [Planctomycetota bacterium]
MAFQRGAVSGTGTVLQLPVQTLAQIRDLLESRGLAPKKSLGQNFLIDHNLIRKLVDAASVHTGDLVLEVGPGTGALTDELVARGCRVIACELDEGLASLIEERFAANPNVTVIQGDCLESKRELSRAAAAALGSRPFKLIANLPYGAATPLLIALMTQHLACSGMWITVQREVGDRLIAKAGSDDYGTISIISAAACEGRKIARLGPECFWPRPEIESVMIELVRKPTALTNDLPGLADFTQALFNKRRKQLGAVLRSMGAVGGEITHLDLPAGIIPTSRAENLTPQEVISVHEWRKTRSPLAQRPPGVVP